MAKLNIEYKQITDLKKYDKNPRKNEKAIDIVKKSINEFGFLNPILVDKDNIIIAGHTRYEAALQLGLKEVPTISIDTLTPAQVNAFRIMDNKSQQYAGWDYDLLKDEFNFLINMDFDMNLTGFKESEINRIINAIPERIEGGKEAKYQIEEGIYKLGQHYLIVGDCTKNNYSQILGNQEIQLIYTDPPYGVSYAGNHSETIQEKLGMRMVKDWDIIENDDLRGEELYNLLKDAFAQASPYLKKGCAAYVFHASRNQPLFQKALEDTGWEIKQQLIWKKPAVLSHAHYHWAHEPIFYCSRINSPSNFYGDYQNQTIINEGLDELTREQLIEIIESFKHTTIQEHKKDASNDYIHPTQKPVKMAEYFITNSTQPEEWVLDMFGGSGSTLIACENKNRKCIICEIDKKYASHIIERWENKTGKTYQKIQ